MWVGALKTGLLPLIAFLCAKNGGRNAALIDWGMGSQERREFLDLTARHGNTANKPDSSEISTYVEKKGDLCYRH